MAGRCFPLSPSGRHGGLPLRVVAPSSVSFGQTRESAPTRGCAFLCILRADTGVCPYAWLRLPLHPSGRHGGLPLRVGAAFLCILRADTGVCPYAWLRLPLYSSGRHGGLPLHVVAAYSAFFGQTRGSAPTHGTAYSAFFGQTRESAPTRGTGSRAFPAIDRW